MKVKWLFEKDVFEDNTDKMIEEGDIKVLEIGCFSCAGMYNNNLRRVISAVSKAALKEWNEYFNE